MLAHLSAFVAAVTMSAASTPANLTIHLRESGCAAQYNRPVFVSVWSALAYPGDGEETTHFWIASEQTTTTLSLSGGYYRFMMSSAACWEQPQMVAVISGVNRDVTLEFSSFVCGPSPTATPYTAKDGSVVRVGADCYTYTLPGGGVDGLVPSTVSTVELDGINGRTSGKTWTTKTENGAYYFDRIPPGEYLVRALSPTGASEHDVTISNDALYKIDFRLVDFAD